MPDPTIQRQIEELLVQGVSAGVFPADQVEIYRRYLTRLADAAEAGDEAAAAKLADDYGLLVGSTEPGPGGLPAPDMGGQRQEGPPYQGTYPGEQRLPQGWYTHTDPATGKVLIIDPKANIGTGQMGTPVYGPKIMATLTPPATSTRGEVTWSPPQWVRTPDGRYQQLVVSSTGETKVLTTTAAPESTVMTPYQAGSLGVAQGNLSLSGQRLGFDVTKWQAEQQAAADKLAAAQAALPQNLAYTNPDNPNEAAQRQEWQQARKANGEDPYDFGAYQQHMQAIGAPPPSYDGFAMSSQGLQLIQTRQQQVDDINAGYQQAKDMANLSYEHQVNILGIDPETARLNRAETVRQADMNYDISLRQIGLTQQQIDLTKQTTAIDAAKAGNVLDYLALTRGGVPGAGGSELYAGSGVRSLTAPAVDVYGGNASISGTTPTISSNMTPSLDGVGGTVLTPEMADRARAGLRAAGWPEAETASMGQVVSQYLKVAQPDDFYRQLQAAYSGGPASPTSQPPNNMAEVRRQLAGANWPGGNDEEALAAFMRTAKDDNPLKIKLRGGGLAAPSLGGTTGQSPWNPPEMPPYIAAVQGGQAVSRVGLPAGTNLRLPSIQQQANATPMETASLNNLASYVMPPADWEAAKANIRGSLGPSLGAGLMAPSSLRSLGR